MSDAEIEKMVKDAEANAEADKAKKAIVEARNQADSLVYETEKSLKEHGDKVDASTKSDIEDELKKLKDLLAKEDANAEDLKAGSDALLQKSMKLGEEIYKATQAQQAGAEAQPSDSQSTDENSGEKVVDAEYEEVKDEEKKG